MILSINKLRKILLLSVVISVLIRLNPCFAFSFVVFGDNRDGDKLFQELIQKVNQEKEVDFCVNTGDMVPISTEKNYKNYLSMISKLKPKIYHVPGNHDVLKDNYKLYIRYLGSTYYSFDHKGSHFIVLDNALSNSFDLKQFKWLKADLQKNRYKNIFVFMHRPLFDPTEIYKDHIMSGRQVIKELMELFERYRVCYVIAGHIHGYARAKRGETVYMICGGAGAPLYLPKDFGGIFHYVKITVDDSKISDSTIKLNEDKENQKSK